MARVHWGWSSLVALAVVGGAAEGYAAGRQLPLITAIKNGGGATTVRALLQRHADVNEAEGDGTSALQWAAELNDVHTVDLLINAGADVTAMNRFGASALSLAAMNGHAEVIQRLLGAGADPNQIVGHEPVLMMAARSGNVDAVTYLLAAGADVNVKEPDRLQTSLMWAAARGHLGVVRVLLAAGADIAARSKGPSCQGSAGYGGCRAPSEKSADRLRLERQKDPLGIRSNTGGEYGENADGMEFTAFLFAVRAGHLDIVTALLDAGAPVNDAKTDLGTTALILAIMNHHWELASVLLDRGADPNRGPGYTALHQLAWARRYNTWEFIPHPVPTGTLDSLTLAKRLIEDGVDVNAPMTTSFQDGYRSRMRRVGATAFLLSSKLVDVPMMRLLAANGADIHRGNIDNSTPLMLAAGVDMLNENEDIGTETEAVAAVQLLLDLGADPQAVNDNGENAMHGAIGYRGWVRVAQLLHQRGVSFDRPNIIGWTPLRIADGVYFGGFLTAQPKGAGFARELYAQAGMPVPPPPSEELNSIAVLTGELAVDAEAAAQAAKAGKR
jgi:ankyrin repeat protein